MVVMLLQAALFPQIAAAIQSAIVALGGAVVPKLNWSCPKVKCMTTCVLSHPCPCCDMGHLLVQDATWVSASNSIKCTNADEILLLLKSSDRVAHDICNAFDSCIDRPRQEVPYVLVLKTYYDLKPEREFRCFVKNHDLIGMCSQEVQQSDCCPVCTLANVDMFINVDVKPELKR